MKRKNYEQYKRIVRFLSSSFVTICVTLIFIFIWREFYNEGIVFPFYYKGYLLVAAFYALFFILFSYIYGGMKFGYLKNMNVIFSQVLSVLCANMAIYLETVLLSVRFVAFTPIILLTIIELIGISIWSPLLNLLFKRLFPPHRLLLIFEEYDPTDMLRKMEGRKDRYRIYKSIKVNQNKSNESNETIKKMIGRYDGVLLYDVHSAYRNQILKYCYAKGIRTYVTPKISDILIKSSENIHLFDTPLLLLRNNGLTMEERFLKRFLDILISLIVVVVTSPILLIVSLAIKVYDRGPVFFKQRRCTIDGKIFEIHKFRSMIVDAEKDGISIPATDKDPRITPIGAVIRKTRLDELPQIIDILVGNMSLVGPRPERVEHVQQYTEDIPEFEYRLKVKGGLTGYAQIYGKYNTTAYDKLKLDLMYIQNYSILLDIKLILMTIKIMFINESTEGFEDKEKEKKEDE